MSMFSLYPLTYPQRAIWLTEKVYPNTSIHNITCSVKIMGEVDYSLLSEMINLCLEQNDGLRLRLIEHNGQPKQYVSPYTRREIPFFDFSQSAGPEEQLYAWDRKITASPMKLIESDLCDFALFRLSSSVGGFYIKLHHLISDAWGLAITVDWILKNYFENCSKKNIEDCSKGNGSKQRREAEDGRGLVEESGWEDNEEDLGRSSQEKGRSPFNGQCPFEEEEKRERGKCPSYLDYLLSEQAFTSSARWQKNKAFWEEKFSTIPELTDLTSAPLGQRRLEAVRKTFLLDQALTAQVRGLCRQLGISVPVLFQALIFTYLYRLTSQHDLIIGTPLLNRLTPAEKNTIGMFVHNLPLRLYVDEAKPLGDFVHEVAKEARAVLKHQRYPYELLLRYVRQRHNLQSTLYSLVLSPINASLDSYNRQHVRVRWLFPESQPEPLIIHLTDPASSDPAGEGRLMMHYDHRLDLYSPADIERLHQHLLNLLTDAAHHPEKRLYELKLLSEAEERQILYEFNQTSLDYPQKDKTVHQLFEEQSSGRLKALRWSLGENP